MKSDKPVRVLHVLGIMNLGGAESRVMDLYHYIDRDKIQFDFLVHRNEKGHFDEEIEKLGGKIYRISQFYGWNYFRYKKEWNKFFKEHYEYQAVHGHMTSTAAIYLPIAKKYGIKKTIAHARSAGVDKGIKGIITKIIRYPLRWQKHIFLACSKKAGEAVFGKRCANSGRVKIIPNTIEAEKFIYNPAIQEKVRKRLGITNQFVVGHVGRFHYAKNHEYLLRIFQQFLKKAPNSILLLIGKGELERNIRNKVKKLGLQKNVFFLGNQNKIENFYQAMDIFILPSRYEGLPGSVVEAQAAGLKCFISEAVTKEVKITDLVTFLKLSQEPKIWADKMIQNKDYNRKSQIAKITEAGFNIKQQIAEIEKLYLDKNDNYVN